MTCIGSVPERNNLIINGGFSIAQRGTSFTSATWRTNADDSYLLDRWLLLSDGNDIVDVSQVSGAFSRSRYALQAEVETANKRFGFCQIIEASTCIPLRGHKISVSFAVKTLADKVINNIRVAVLEWTSTADTVTSDVVSNWASDLTFATNWAALNTPGNLALTTSEQTFKVEDITIGASCNNLAVFVWVDDTDCVVDDILQLGEVQVVLGNSVSTFQNAPSHFEIEACLRRYQETASSMIVGAFTTVCWAFVTFPTPMAYTPTVTPYSNSTNAAGKFFDSTAGSDVNVSDSSSYTSKSGIYALGNSTAVYTVGRYYSGYFRMEAEL
jgi:hypothetical protein